MKILIVGSGGREHALAWKLSQEAEVFCTPGNPGIAQVAKCFEVKASDHQGINALCHELQVDLVVIGPEDPLIAGLADDLRQAGLVVFGPGKEGAQLEGSKAFSKGCMASAGIPTAAFETFTDPNLARMYAFAQFNDNKPVVVKASGAALGKGVVVCSTFEEADQAIQAMMVEGQLGEAGKTVVIEERLIGREFSLLTICSDKGIFSLPVAQDYKRALDGDRGPNTGGMGAVSPIEWVSDDMVVQAENKVVLPLLAHLKEIGISYRGVLFSGLMVCRSGMYCLEYNVRFGDPETQSVMRRLGKGFATLLLVAAKGEAIGKDVSQVEIMPHAAITVVIASGGYPGEYSKGEVIHFPESLDDSVVIFHAGTALEDNEVVTSGGRVLGVSAVGSSGAEANEKAYQVAKMTTFNGSFYRKDIGH